MKKLTVLFLLVATIVLAPPAAAREDPRQRSDANEKTSVLDIHHVTTWRWSQPRGQLGIAIESWYDFSDGDININEGEFYLIRFDTYGDDRIDRWVYIYYEDRPERNRLYCDKRRQGRSNIDWASNPDTHGGPRILGCTIRRTWLAPDGPVEFNVAAFEDNHPVDRAPDHDRYRGL